MTINMEQAIAKMMQLQALDVHYSMNGSRTGADGTADCSGAVYAALVFAGAKPNQSVISTETEHAWLLANGFQLIAKNQNWQMKRGDILIFGLKGLSAGANGHTAIALNTQQVIHCNARNDGISIDDEGILPYELGWYVYRLAKTSHSSQTQPHPQANATNQTSLAWIAEKGIFQLAYPIHLRTSPTTSAIIIATLPAKSLVRYEAYTYTQGYVWIRQQRANGQYGYLATGECIGTQRQTYWGKFY